MPLSRRSLLAAGAAATAAPWLTTTQLFGAEAPSNRLRVGFIGTGNQGMGLLKRLLQWDLADVVAVCDVNRGSYGYKEDDHFYGREPAQQMVETANDKRKRKTPPCVATAISEEVLARDDIDAVFLVVPDHWHTPLVVAAAAAGKHIYCEKPLTLTVNEGQEMIQAVETSGVVLQVGSHERSNPVSRYVCDAVRDGAIGKVRRVVTVVGYNNKTSPGPGWKPMPVPEGFDYARWLGPAPQVPYHQDRCLYRFRFNYDYSGGQITNYGAHSNDMAQWGLGRDLDGPQQVECRSAKFLPAGSLFNTATETSVRCLYNDGTELVCESGPEGVQTRFEGEDGWMQTGYRGTTASRPELLTDLPDKEINGRDPYVLHMQNFVDAIRSKAELRAPVDVGHASATLCHIMNVAIRRYPQTGTESLRWDPRGERFVDNEAANRWLMRNKT